MKVQTLARILVAHSEGVNDVKYLCKIIITSTRTWPTAKKIEINQTFNEKI